MRLALLPLLPLLLAACADSAPRGIIPEAPVSVVVTAPPGGWGGAPAPTGAAWPVHAHPTHTAVAYEPMASCGDWNAAYAMHSSAALRCAQIYVPGQIQPYRQVVYHDAHGRAYVPIDGKWTRSAVYDTYVQGQQPHR